MVGKSDCLLESRMFLRTYSVLNTANLYSSNTTLQLLAVLLSTEASSQDIKIQRLHVIFVFLPPFYVSLLLMRNPLGFVSE